jgi:hypothetical protein
MRRIVTPARPARLMAFFAVGAVTLALAACGGASGEEPTPAPTPDPTPAATATPSETGGSLTSVREVNFADPAVIGPIIDRFGGGEIEPARILYVDLTHDGQEDAFVFVESGGTMGDLGAVLVGIEDGQAVILGVIDVAGRVDLRFPEIGGGIVVATEGVWEPGDALCCPSLLREQTFEWREGGFVLVDEQVVDNPDVD